MSQTLQTTAAMNPPEMEQALRGLWHRLTQENKPDAPFIQKHAVNLVAVVADSQGAAEAGKITADLAKRHPGRYFILVLNPDREALRNRDSGQSQCSLTVSCAADSCYEQIIIPNLPGQAGQLPQLIKALLHQELPVILWWRYLFYAEEPLFQGLAALAGQVILDSVTMKNPRPGFAKILALTQEANKQQVSDLNWARLTPWRVALANLYDIAAYRPFLERVSHVEIEYSHQLSRHHLINNSQVLLLFGWLAGRLGWCLHSGIAETQPEILYQLEAVNHSGHSLLCQFRVFAAASHHDAGLKQVRLTAEGTPSAQFSISLCQDAAHLHTRISLPENSPAEKITCLEVGTETDLVAHELTAGSQDSVYQQTLTFLERNENLWKAGENPTSSS